MRFDTPIYFQRLEKGDLDAQGNREAIITSEVERFASVTNSGTATLNLVYGELRQGSLTIRLQNAYTEPFDRIRIGEKVYRVDMSRRLRTKQAFVVSEVQ